MDTNWREDFTRNRVIGFVIALVLSLIILPLAAPPQLEAEAQTARVAAREAGSKTRDALVEEAGDEAPLKIRVKVDGPEHLIEPVVTALRHERLEVTEDANAVAVNIQSRVDGEKVHVAFGHADAPVGEGVQKRIGRFSALMPPLLAILIALFFRRILFALAAAVWLGGTLAVGGNPITGLLHGVNAYVIQSVTDSFKFFIIGFTLCLVGMVQIVTRMGGIAGLLDRFRRFTKTRRSARATTAALGTVIFFDDYANTIVVGSSMRPITDKLGISREKLAYLVDSTSAPIAGIAIISTWVGYEVGLFDEISQQLGLGRTGYDIFISIVGLRFYCLLTLVFVVANTLLARDFGPMLTAERRAHGGEVSRSGAKTLAQEGFAATQPEPGIPLRWYNAVLPIGVVMFATMIGLFWSGWSQGDASIPALFGINDEGFFITSPSYVLTIWDAASPDLGSFDAWRGALGDADSGKVLFTASILGTLVATLLAVGQKLLTFRQTVATFGQAIKTMWMAIAILVLAWSIQEVCKELGTSIYLVGAVGDLLTPAALPILTFLLAAVVAFATGTSWGTMGILLPAMVPLAFYMTDGSTSSEIIVFLCFSAVLDGAIFGDHCSPISDTTVMSSIASSCDHLDHVRTQVPYAMTTMLMAGAFGYLGVAFGLNPHLALALGAVGVVAALMLLGRPAPISESLPENSTAEADGA